MNITVNKLSNLKMTGKYKSIKLTSFLCTFLTGRFFLNLDVLKCSYLTNLKIIQGTITKYLIRDSWKCKVP